MPVIFQLSRYRRAISLRTLDTPHRGVGPARKLNRAVLARASFYGGTFRPYDLWDFSALILTPHS